MMEELLSTLVGIFVPLFAAGSMLTVGFRYSVQEIIKPLRDIVGVITVVVANFVLVPLLAVVILRLLPLDTPLAIGLILVSVAAGAPMLIRLTQMAREHVAFAASILVLLVLATMIYMPLVIPRLASGAPVSAMSIARPLLMTMLLPLCIAFLVRALWPRTAETLLPWVGKITNIALYIMIAATVLGNLNNVISVFGTGAIGAALLLIGGAFVIGYLVGTFDKPEKIVLGFATAQRNFGAATVVAVQSFTDPGVLVMTVVCSTVAMLLLPFARLVGKRKASTAVTEGHVDGASRKETQTAA
jgi:BASS family bile acid:Na+ symporter